MKVRLSRWHEDVVVCEVVDNTAPPHLLEALKHKGLGCALWGDHIETPIIVIDNRGGLTHNQLLAVEAHELGHIMTNSVKESDAEVFAIALLRANGRLRAAQLLIERGVVCKEDVDRL